MRVRELEMATKPAVIHPHIERRHGVVGGEPVIVGTRFPVRSVVGYVLKFGMTPEELVRDFSFLTLAQVYDALSYYYDYKEQIDQDILENSEEYCRARMNDSDSPVH
jgi:uncharacterized protein (DUF433 family)